MSERQGIDVNGPNAKAVWSGVVSTVGVLAVLAFALWLGVVSTDTLETVLLAIIGAPAVGALTGLATYRKANHPPAPGAAADEPGSAGAVE